MKNIFLAEDDLDDCMFFEDALKEIDVPVQLTISSNGVELMRNLESLTSYPPPDVIFLDLNMPFKNGLECLKEIRETPKMKDIPIVVFSTSNKAEMVDKSYVQGANYYVCKPKSFPLLVKAIDTAINAAQWQKAKPPKEKFLLEIT